MEKKTKIMIVVGIVALIVFFCLKKKKSGGYVYGEYDGYGGNARSKVRGKVKTNNGRRPAPRAMGSVVAQSNRTKNQSNITKYNLTKNKI